MNKLAIYTLPKSNDESDEGFAVFISQNETLVEISSDNKDLVDFYSAIIPASSVFSEIKKDNNALRKIVSSMYGGAVASVDRNEITEQDFEKSLSSSKYKKNISL